LEVGAWEISLLGSCHLGKCHLGSCPWENPFGKIPNTIANSQNVHYHVATNTGLRKLKFAFCLFRKIINLIFEGWDRGDRLNDILQGKCLFINFKNCNK